MELGFKCIMCRHAFKAEYGTFDKAIGPSCPKCHGGMCYVTSAAGMTRDDGVKVKAKASRRPRPSGK